MTDRTPNRKPDSHDAEGQFTTTLADSSLAADAARLRATGLSYREIGKVQEISASTAFDRVKRAIAAVPVEAVAELRAVSAERLNMLIVRAMTIATAQHPLVSHGRLIPNTYDLRPNLAAIREVRMLDAELRTIFGVNEPVKHELRVSDSVVAEIEMLAQQLNIGFDTASAGQIEGPR